MNVIPVSGAVLKACKCASKFAAKPSASKYVNDALTYCYGITDGGETRIYATNSMIAVRVSLSSSLIIFEGQTAFTLSGSNLITSDEDQRIGAHQIERFIALPPAEKSADCVVFDTALLGSVCSAVKTLSPKAGIRFTFGYPCASHFVGIRLPSGIEVAGVIMPLKR